MLYWHDVDALRDSSSQLFVYFFLPSFPRVNVWCPEFILSASYCDFRLWKSAICSSSCLRCSSTVFFSSDTETFISSNRACNCKKKRNMLFQCSGVMIKTNLLFRLFELSFLFLDSNDKFLSHFFLLLLERGQVQFSSGVVLLSEISRFSLIVTESHLKN